MTQEKNSNRRDSNSDLGIPPPLSAVTNSHCDLPHYQALYQQSIADPDKFWAEQAKCLDWVQAPTRIANWSYDPVDIRWFDDGVLNICYNAIDRHVAAGRGADVALICEPDSPPSAQDETAHTLTYDDLQKSVIHMAATLKNLGIHKGERVTIYMPMIAEGVVAMLACARIGAVHSVIFGGFSPEAIAGRIKDCASRWVICADIGRRGGKTLPLKANVDAALDRLNHRGTEQNTTPSTSQSATPSTETKIEAVLVIRNSPAGASDSKKPIASQEDCTIPMLAGRDHWYHDCAAARDATADPTCPCEPMQAEDPLFILYTSGSTGKPKGVVHSTGGYAVWTATSFHYIFDYRPGEIYWCTADIGWITGHSYIVYGPLLNGAKVLIYEGVPSYPDHDRFWQIIAKHRVSIFYTAPTVIRALSAMGAGYVAKHDLSSLRLLGTVGEPINPEAWRWYYRFIGGDKCAIVDTWWQTETGGVMISTLPGAHAMKPGSAGQPFFGIRPQLIDSSGAIVEGAGEGNLCIVASWPGQARTVYGDHARFITTYFSSYGRKDGTQGTYVTYVTGDGCRRDGEGYYWITGRVDDVINISGHRMGTAEIENALVLHSKVAEAAVVGFSHPIKGQALYCYVTLNAGVLNADLASSAELEKDLRTHVRTVIGAIATPDHIHLTSGLPKTRSGKIMRRILRKIAENDCAALGDTSTLADPSLVARLIAERKNR